MRRCVSGRVSVNPTGVCLDRCCSLARSFINAENLTCWLRRCCCCCRRRTWASLKTLANCKGIAALEMWLIDAPRILFVYLCQHTFVYALWPVRSSSWLSELSMADCGKSWLTLYAKFAATQQTNKQQTPLYQLPLTVRSFCIVYFGT